MKKTVTIHGQKWDIHLVPQSKLTDYRKQEQSDGDCIVPMNPAARLSRKERRIRICKTLDDETMMETLQHEALHAMFPDKNEEWIAQTAEDLKNILRAFGYHRKGTDDAA